MRLTGSVPEAPREILRFDLRPLSCALPLSSVREVQRAVEITALPGAPRVIEGVVDLRGTIVPVVNVRDRLGLPAAAVRASDFLIFVWTGARLVAVRADTVHGIEHVDAEDFAAADLLTRGSTEVAGVVRAPSGLVLVHDAESLLRQGEAEAVDRALAELGAA